MTTKIVALPGHAGHKLRADAANAWERAKKAAGLNPVIASSYRDPDCGVRPSPLEPKCYCSRCIFLNRYTVGDFSGKQGFTTDVRTYEGKKYTRKAGKAAAAVPGTSNHSSGLAVDVATTRSASTPGRPHVVFTGWADTDRTRFLTAARPHGWDDTEGRAVSEHWHLTYYPAKDKNKAK